MIIDGEEYVSLKEAAEILKSQNIKLINILSTFKRRIKKRSFIKKIDVENLVTFHRESKLLEKEFAEKKTFMMVQYKKEMDIKVKELKEKYGVPVVTTIMIEGEEYIGVRLATEILGINSHKLNQLSCWNLIKRFYKKSKPWMLKSDVEKIKVEAGSGFEKICEKYDDKIKAYKAQQKKKHQEYMNSLKKKWNEQFEN
ncbi:MAG: hypothetical protein FJX70_07955 [Alphaproteobacteria bacterium]|nr:hypothetical protein [Alphaproteobacteria bacterium]